MERHFWMSTRERGANFGRNARIRKDGRDWEQN